MPLNENQTRAPKQIGDFGEALTTYTLIRKGFEVARVDHVGADLIAEKDHHRFALSVKTRFYRAESRETRAVFITNDNLKKLKIFAEQFGMVPLLSFAFILVADDIMHIAMFHSANIGEVMKPTTSGYRRNVDELVKEEKVDYSFWYEKQIGSSNFI